jgi:phage terminase small subunit
MNDPHFPKPQEYLTKIGRGIFYELCEHLFENSGFRHIDTFGLSMLAQALEDYAEASKKVSENGKVQTFPNGTQNVSAWYTVQRDAQAQVLRLSQKYGLSVFDRGTIGRLQPTTETEVAKPDALDLI